MDIIVCSRRIDCVIESTENTPLTLISYEKYRSSSIRLFQFSRNSETEQWSHTIQVVSSPLYDSNLKSVEILGISPDQLLLKVLYPRQTVLLLVGLNNSIVRKKRVITGFECGTLCVYDREIFLPTGNGGSVEILNVENLETNRTVELGMQCVSTVRMSSDGKLAAVSYFITTARPSDGSSKSPLTGRWRIRVLEGDLSTKLCDMSVDSLMEHWSFGFTTNNDIAVIGGEKDKFDFSFYYQYTTSGRCVASHLQTTLLPGSTSSRLLTQSTVREFDVAVGWSVLLPLNIYKNNFVLSLEMNNELKDALAKVHANGEVKQLCFNFQQTNSRTDRVSFSV